VANIRSLAALSSATGIDCELQTAGALQVFNRPQDAAAARAYVQRARALKFPVELWDAKQVAEALGTPAYAGGFFDPNGGQVHPMKLVQVFKAAAQGAGAAVYENTRVDAIEEGAVHVLRIGGHIVKARSLVLATNAFTPNLGFLRNSVMPLREYVAMTGPLSERDFEELGWRSRMPFNDSRTEVFYLGVTRDRRIHIGGGAPHYDFNNGAGAAAAAPTHVLALKRELARIFPRLAGIDFDLSWNGVVDWSLDAAPSVGSIGKHRNIFYGLGYSGHGVNLTSIFGRIIADLAAGREAQWRHFPFVNARFGYVPNEPFRLAAARASLAWYGLTE
jgi:glycine/D-amino acid oxidase-like deaminating enzyme